MELDYFDFEVSEEGPLGGQATIPQVIALIHWATDRLDIDATDALTFNFLGATDDEFQALGQAAPVYNTIQRDLKGLRHVLTIISTATLLLAENITNIVTKITEKLGDDQRKTALFQFLYTRVNRVANSSYWDDLRNYFAHLLQHSVFVEHSTFDALKLADSYEKFVRAVDPLANHLFRLDTRQITLVQAKTLNT